MFLLIAEKLHIKGTEIQRLERLKNASQSVAKTTEEKDLEDYFKNVTHDFEAAETFESMHLEKTLMKVCTIIRLLYNN